MEATMACVEIYHTANQKKVTDFDHTNMEISESTSSGGQIGYHLFSNFFETFCVLRCKYTEGTVHPVDLNSKVVPGKRVEGDGVDNLDVMLVSKRVESRVDRAQTLRA